MIASSKAGLIITIIVLSLTLPLGSCSWSIELNEKDQFHLFRSLALELVERDHMKSEGYLLRWIQAHDFDVDKATEALHKTMEWRTLNNIDQILSEDFSQLEKELGTLIDDSVDKEGRPLFVCALGQFDMRKAVIGGYTEKYKRLIIRNLELIEILAYQNELATKTINAKLPQFVGLFDWNGFSVKQVACQACLTACVEMMILFESNYPGISYRSFNFNTPKIYFTLFNLVKQVMSSKTLDSVRLFGFNKVEWSRAMLEVIPANQFLAQYGGTKALLVGNDGGSRSHADKNLWNSITNETRRKLLGQLSERQGSTESPSEVSQASQPPFHHSDNTQTTAQAHHHYCQLPPRFAKANTSEVPSKNLARHCWNLNGTTSGICHHFFNSVSHETLLLYLVLILFHAYRFGPEL